MSLPQDDDDSLLQSVPYDKIDDGAPWVELSEIGASPCTLPDYCPTPPEDMDVFAKEDGPEGGLWCLHEADISVVDAMLAPPESVMCEAQSDGSLIDAPTLLASTITRPPQVCIFTLYHHQDVDHREPDPAESGSHDYDSQTAQLEKSGASAMFANLTRLPLNPLHDHGILDGHRQLMPGCQVDFESLETLDNSSERGEVGDSDSVLLELDVDLDWLV